MSGGMVFHSPSFRYCHWSERSSPTLKRVLNTSPLSQQDFQGTPRRSRAAGVISCALNHSWCNAQEKIGRAHVWNSSHQIISYAVFCLKKKKKKITTKVAQSNERQ